MRLHGVIRGKRRNFFIRLLVNGSAQSATAVTAALVFRSVFDRMAATGQMLSPDRLVILAAGIAALAGAVAWLRMRERIDAEQMGQNFVHHIRMRLFAHLSALAPRALQKRSRGAVVLRFVGDLNAVKRWVSLGLARICVAGIVATGTLGVLAVLNPLLGAGVAAVIGLGAYMSFRLGRRLRDAAREGRRRRSLLAANVTEKVGAMAVVQAFDQMDREKRHLRRQSRRLSRAMIVRAGNIGWQRAVTHSVMVLANGVVILLGAREVAVGRISPGTLVAAMTVVGLLVPAIGDLGRVYEYWHDARLSMQKIRRFLRMPSLVPEVPGAEDLLPVEGRLTFDKVSVTGAVDGFSAVAEPGTVVGITGPNGAGKSTLLSLAARLIDPDHGRVLIDGRDLTQYSISSIRQAVGMASADLPLLRGTIRKNLLYRWPDAPEAEIEKVMALCDIQGVLAEMPDGIDARVVEGGKNLSLGQRQRITLARALLGTPSILLLDEADVHFDPAARAVFDRVVDTYPGTVLLVTQSRQRLARTDVIWHILKGRLMEITAAKAAANPVADRTERQGGLTSNL